MSKDKNRVYIFDTTMRDGEQSPGASMSLEEKLQISRLFDQIGIDIIEAGFPAASKGDFESVSEVSKILKTSIPCGLSRHIKKDIDACHEALKSAKRFRIHTFISTSPLHMKHKLNKSPKEVVEAIKEHVTYARKFTDDVEWSCEDGTRTDMDFMCKTVELAIKCGAKTINIPDTVGYSTPQYIAEITRDAIEATKLPISMHCHNDFGLAVANAISGIQAGAQCAHVTINGIGERAGNASLEELVMALQCLRFDQSWETNIKTELLYETSKYVSKLAGMPVQPNKAIIGENAFGHESGIHTHGVLSNPLTYEPISPEIVGRNRWLQVGKHAGAHGISAMLEEYGVKPDKDQLKQILEKVKSIGDQGKHVTDVELLSISNEVMGDSKLKRLVKLTGFSVSTGIGNMPYAFIKLNIDGEEHTATDYGVGPVDASLNAIQKITGKISEIRINDYNLASISGGSSALCEVTVKLEDAMQNTVSSKSIGEDIVITSVQAVIDGMNRLLLKKLVKQKKA